MQRQVVKKEELKRQGNKNTRNDDDAQFLAMIGIKQEKVQQIRRGTINSSRKVYTAAQAQRNEGARVAEERHQQLLRQGEETRRVVERQGRDLYKELREASKETERRFIEQNKRIAGMESRQRADAEKKQTEVLQEINKIRTNLKLSEGEQKRQMSELQKKVEKGEEVAKDAAKIAREALDKIDKLAEEMKKNNEKQLKEQQEQRAKLLAEAAAAEERDFLEQISKTVNVLWCPYCGGGNHQIGCHLQSFQGLAEIQKGAFQGTIPLAVWLVLNLGVYTDKKSTVRLQNGKDKNFQGILNTVGQGYTYDSVNAVLQEYGKDAKAFIQKYNIKTKFDEQKSQITKINNVVQYKGMDFTDPSA